jgi:hypothetical protein
MEIKIICLMCFQGEEEKIMEVMWMVGRPEVGRFVEWRGGSVFVVYNENNFVEC